MGLKRVAAAVVFVISAPAVFAGVFYRIESVDAAGVHGQATVSVDGDAMRIDSAQSCVVITDHGRRARAFSPDKWYLDSPAESVAPPLIRPLRGEVRLTKPAVTVRTPPGTRTIAGYTAHHVIVDASWVIEADFPGHVVTIPNSATWDLWKTNQLSSSLEDPMAELIVRTGDPQMDRLLAAHPVAVEGFALSGSLTRRQEESIRTVSATISDVDTKHGFAPNFIAGPAGYVKLMLPAQPPLESQQAMTAVLYRFETVTSGFGEQRMSGTVESQGLHMRINIASGDGVGFANGSLVFSDGKQVTVFDPGTKTYYEVPIDPLAPFKAILGDVVSMSNQHSSVRDLGNGHNVMQSTYDLNVAVMDKKVAMHLSVTTESWTTNKYPAEASVGRVLAPSPNAPKGFPLKQVTTFSVDQNGQPIQFTSTTTVSDVVVKRVLPADFTMPGGYRKVESPIERAMKSLGR